jgi:dihydrofolate reductase
MRLSLIVAHDEALVIGRDGGLPWRLPEDLRHFKETTMGKPVLMGRGVFEELGEKPLPGRRNVVVSKKKWPQVPSFESIETALEYLADEPEVFVIGGGQIYRALIGKADRLVVTEVPGRHEGEVTFPEYRDGIGSVWTEVSRRTGESCKFVEYQRYQP